MLVTSEQSQRNALVTVTLEATCGDDKVLGNAVAEVVW